MSHDAYRIPNDGYWRVAGKQVFHYPLMAVFALSTREADAIAGPDAYDAELFIAVSMDSMEATHRLGIWGRPDLADEMLRGDLP